MPTPPSPTLNAEDSRPATASNRRALLSIAAVFVVYVATVSTHLGEFWPFSIYPMFSQAGKPWTRAMMLDVTDAPSSIGWGPWPMDELPAPPRPTRSVGLSNNDLSKLVQLTPQWTPERIVTLRRLWQPALSEQRSLLLLRADGRLLPEGGVSISMTPLVKLTPEGDELNPNLPETKP